MTKEFSICWVQDNGKRFYLKSGDMELIGGEPRSTRLSWKPYFIRTCETETAANHGIEYLKVFYPKRTFKVSWKEINE